jgi:hypothetical protein
VALKPLVPLGVARGEREDVVVLAEALQAEPVVEAHTTGSGGSRRTHSISSGKARPGLSSSAMNRSDTMVEAM